MHAVEIPLHAMGR